MVVLTSTFFALPASAAPPTPTPTATTPPPSPTPTPSPSITPSSSASPPASASPSASATPSSAASPSPSASLSPSASPTSTPAAPSPSPSAAPAVTENQSATPVGYATDMEALATATSLASMIDARARIAQAELDALAAREREIFAALGATDFDLATLARSSARRGTLPDRLLREALRLADPRTLVVPATLSADERDTFDFVLQLGDQLRQQRDGLGARQADLAALRDSVAAKRATLAKLNVQARALSDGEGAAGQVAVLRDLADQAAAVEAAITQLVAAVPSDGLLPATAWTMPLKGALTQPFGPSTLGLEPAHLYRGVLYPHFHEGVDIAAPFGSPVGAAANGRVAFVGHLPDGAEVVLLVHDGGLVSLYAHLDDTFAPPAVKAGDTVKAGQVIGFVGMTGVTTGPHLHFSVRHGD